MRRGFSLLELTVTICLMAMVMGGAYFMLSTGQGASQKGVVLLDELSKQIRLTEQLRRVLRTATSVVQTPKADGSTYDITYVARIDEAGPTLVTERARLELTTAENGGLVAVFLREHQKPVRYAFLDMLMDIDVGAGNATLRFTNHRASTSLQLACANLLPSGIPLDPVQRPGPLPSPPVGPMMTPNPQSGGGAGPVTPQSNPHSGGGTATPQSQPLSGSGPSIKAQGMPPAGQPGTTPPQAPPLGPTANSAGGTGGVLTPAAATPTGATAPDAPARATPPQGLAGTPPESFGGSSPQGFAGATPTSARQPAPPEGLAGGGVDDGRTPSRPGLPPMRQGRPGDSSRKPPRPTPPVGWTGLSPNAARGATPLAGPPAAMARPPVPKELKPGATAAAAAPGRPATPASAAPGADRTRLPGDEIPAVATGTVDEPF